MIHLNPTDRRKLAEEKNYATTVWVIIIQLKVVPLQGSVKFVKEDIILPFILIIKGHRSLRLMYLINGLNLIIHKLTSKKLKLKIDNQFFLRQY